MQLTGLGSLLTICRAAAWSLTHVLFATSPQPESCSWAAAWPNPEHARGGFFCWQNATAMCRIAHNPQTRVANETHATPMTGDPGQGHIKLKFGQMGEGTPTIALTLRHANVGLVRSTRVSDTWFSSPAQPSHQVGPVVHRRRRLLSCHGTREFIWCRRPTGLGERGIMVGASRTQVDGRVGKMSKSR